MSDLFNKLFNTDTETETPTASTATETATKPDTADAETTDTPDESLVTLSTHELLNLLFQRLMTTKPTDEPIEFWMQQQCLIQIIAADAAVRIDNTLTDVLYGTDEEDDSDWDDENDDFEDGEDEDEDEEEVDTKGEDETTK